MSTASRARLSRVALVVMLPLLAFECGILGHFRPIAVAGDPAFQLPSGLQSAQAGDCARLRRSYHSDQTFATPPLAYDPWARSKIPAEVPRSAANLLASAPPGATVDHRLGAAVYTRFGQNSSGRSDTLRREAYEACAQTAANSGPAPTGAVIIF